MQQILTRTMKIEIDSTIALNCKLNYLYRLPFFQSLIRSVCAISVATSSRHVRDNKTDNDHHNAIYTYMGQCLY